MRTKFRFTVLFVGWMALITYLSLASLSGKDLSSFDIPHKDKIAHFAFYFGMVVLGCLFLRERSSGHIKLTKAVVLFFLAAVIYGLLMELLQTQITADRDGNWFDALANAVGAFAGSLAVRGLFSQKTRLNWEH